MDICQRMFPDSVFPQRIAPLCNNSVKVYEERERERRPTQRFNRSHSANALSASPRATVVNSSPPRRRSAPNFRLKILLTAGTKAEPPVKKTLSTSPGSTWHLSSSLSTQFSILLIAG